MVTNHGDKTVIILLLFRLKNDVNIIFPLNTIIIIKNVASLSGHTVVMLICHRSFCFDGSQLSKDSTPIRSYKADKITPGCLRLKINKSNILLLKQ